MISTFTDVAGYSWPTAEPSAANRCLMPAVRRVLAQGLAEGRPKRIFDVGCGNGAVAGLLAADGWEVVGVDPSEEGIAHARDAGLNLHLGSAYDDLASKFGRWPFVLSLEVVEHVYFPHRWAKCLRELTEPEGLAIVSTPYHGYLKNLALSLVPGAWDRHWHPLTDHGHIKFWSEVTLGTLLRSAGFGGPQFLRVGRVRPLAKSMIAVAIPPGPVPQL